MSIISNLPFCRRIPVNNEGSNEFYLKPLPQQISNLTKNIFTNYRGWIKSTDRTAVT